MTPQESRRLIAQASYWGCDVHRLADRVSVWSGNTIVTVRGKVVEHLGQPLTFDEARALLKLPSTT